MVNTVGLHSIRELTSIKMPSGSETDLKLGSRSCMRKLYIVSEVVTRAEIDSAMEKPLMVNLAKSKIGPYQYSFAIRQRKSILFIL